MILEDIMERNEILTSILMEDTDASTFDDVKNWVAKCKPTNQELREVLIEIRLSNKIKNKLYDSGVTK